MSLDTVLWFSSTFVEAAVIALLFYRRVWRKFPVFAIYSIWALVSSMGAYAIFRALSPSAYITAYLTEVIIESTLLFSVLVELAWSLLRPIRASLSRRVLVIIAGIIFAVGAAIWPFSITPGGATASEQIRLLLQLRQTVFILQIIVFLAFVASMQLLSIGWRDRELQIATGLGFTSLTGLVIAVLQDQPAFHSQYNHLNQIAVASVLCSLLYWVVSFAQKEEQRREFTPQMQSMLLAVAGAARATRVAMVESGAGSALNGDK